MRTGVPSLQYCIRGDDVAPAVSMGDIYIGINKLAIGSYTDPGTNALSVTGTSSVSYVATFSTGIIIPSGGCTVTGGLWLPTGVLTAGVTILTGLTVTAGIGVTTSTTSFTVYDTTATNRPFTSTAALTAASLSSSGGLNTEQTKFL